MDISLAPFVEVRVASSAAHQWPPDSRPQSGKQNMLWLVQAGSAEVTAAGRKWHIGKGDLFLVARAHRRELVVNTEPFSCLGVGFNVRLFGQFDVLQSLDEPVLWRPPQAEYSRVEEWMRGIYSLMLPFSPNAADALEAYSVHGLARAIWGVCWKHLQSQGKLNTLSPQAGWLVAAFEHLRNHPGTTVAQWSSAVGFSPSQFRRVFGESVGVSPREYLARHRLEQTQGLLLTTDLPIAEVAARLGFHSQPNFITLFKRATGQTPTEYRRAARALREERF